MPRTQETQAFALEVVDENDQEEAQSGSEEPEGPAETEPENQETSPEGEQYDPEDHQERYRFSEMSEDEPVEMRMLHVVPIEELEQENEEMPQLIVVHIPEKVGVAPHNAMIRCKVGFVAPQPEREARYQCTISVLLDVGGIKANVLLDTGCTMDAVSPHFARVAGLKPLELTQQVGLSLAVKGSSSKLNYGTWAEVNLGPIRNANTYLNIINIDRYDVILGTPFLWKHGVSPIFEDGGYIQLKGKRLDIPVRMVS
jgi:Aspartyl protease